MVFGNRFSSKLIFKYDRQEYGILFFMTLFMFVNEILKLRMKAR